MVFYDQPPTISFLPDQPPAACHWGVAIAMTIAVFSPQIRFIAGDCNLWWLQVSHIVESALPPYHAS
jgi:hypothetical protein